MVTRAILVSFEGINEGVLEEKSFCRANRAPNVT